MINLGSGTFLMDAPTLENAPQSISPTWRATRNSHQLIRRADQTITHEYYRARLTQTALNNVAALSELEAHLCEVAPFGEKRYETIVNAYTVSAVQRIVGW